MSFVFDTWYRRLDGEAYAIPRGTPEACGERNDATTAPPVAPA